MQKINRLVWAEGTCLESHGVRNWDSCEPVRCDGSACPIPTAAMGSHRATTQTRCPLFLGRWRGAQAQRKGFRHHVRRCGANRADAEVRRTVPSVRDELANDCSVAFTALRVYSRGGRRMARARNSDSRPHLAAIFLSGLAKSAVTTVTPILSVGFAK